MKGVAVLIFALIILSGCRPAAAPVTISNRPASVNDVPVKQILTELAWTDPTGKKMSLADLHGKPVILDFWATYCIPCRDEIPHLNELQAKHADNGLVVFGLNSGGDEDKPKIPEFLKQTAIKYEMGFPGDDLASYVFDGDDRIPQTLVIDRSGRLVKKFVGFSQQISRDLDAAVDSAVNSQ